MTIEIIDREPAIEEGLNFLLEHFEPPIWPRTISTKTTEGKQFTIYNNDEALARFAQANYLDCRISAYPNYTKWDDCN